MTRPMIFLCSYLSSSFLVLATLVSSVNSGQAWLVPFLFLVFGCVSPASACSDFSLPSCCNLMGHLWEMLLGTIPIIWTPGAENKNNRVFLWLQNLLVSGFHILEQNPPILTSQTEQGTGDSKTRSAPLWKPNTTAVHTHVHLLLLDKLQVFGGCSI